MRRGLIAFSWDEIKARTRRGASLRFFGKVTPLCREQNSLLPVSDSTIVYPSFVIFHHVLSVMRITFFVVINSSVSQCYYFGFVLNFILEDARITEIFFFFFETRVKFVNVINFMFTRWNILNFMRISSLKLGQKNFKLLQ